jgi:AraC-like DNA-binding protein
MIDMPVMDFHLYLIALVMLIPISTVGVCMMLTAFSRSNCLTRQEKTLKSILVMHLFQTFLAWSTLFCYIFFPETFVYLNILCLAGCILAPVFFYRIIRFLTRLEQQEERFSPWHYLAPALIGAAFLVCALIVPFDVQAEIFRSKKLVMPGEYEIYSRIFTSHPFMRLVFVLVYYNFIARRLIRYYRRANDADVPVHKPAQWMVFLIVLSVAFVASSLTSALLPRESGITSVWTAIAAFNISGQMIVLTFHIVRRRYQPYAVHPEQEEEVKTKEEVEKNEESEEQEDDRRFHSGKLTRRRVNAYFREEKPYLRADFKITDLAEAMDVNRSVMSGFINKAYGMNFNRFLNQLRMRELERLQALPSNKEKNISKLIGKAGFTEERQYQRTKKNKE